VPRAHGFLDEPGINLGELDLAAADQPHRAVVANVAPGEKQVAVVTGAAKLGHVASPHRNDPVTPGHLDIIERARHLFARITVLVAVNADKQPASSQSERETQLRRRLPADWDNVSVAAWAGLTVEFCRQHGDGVIIRGVRQGSDLRHEYQLAAMNEALGITTLLLPAKPRLAAVSSTVLRGLGT